MAPRNSGAASDYLIFMLDINVMAFMTISTRRFVITISVLNTQDVAAYHVVLSIRGFTKSTEGEGGV